MRQSTEVPFEFSITLPGHVLVLEMSPLPDVYDVCFSGRFNGRSFNIGHLNALPVNTYYLRRYSSGSRRYLLIKIEPDWFADLVNITSWDPRISLNIVGTPIEASMLRVARELVNPEIGRDRLIAAQLTSIAIDFGRYLEKRKAETASKSKSRAAYCLSKVNDHLQAEERAPPTIAELAHLINVSPRYLTQIFKEHTGLTIHGYVSQIRAGRASRLLTTTTLSIKEIAYKVGFATTSGFCNSFRQSTGYSPTGFRRQMNKIRTERSKKKTSSISSTK